MVYMKKRRFARRKGFLKYKVVNLRKQKNKVSFDTMILINMIECDQSIIEILKQTVEKNKRTKFFLSSKTIGEAKGVLINRHGYSEKQFEKALKRVMTGLKIIPLKYDKTIDDAGGLHLAKLYKIKFGEKCHIPDAIMISHLHREGINVVYSNEKSVRRLAEILGMEGRKLFTSFGGIPRQRLKELFGRRR